MLGTYLSQVYIGQGFPLNRIIVIVSDSFTLIDGGFSVEEVAGLADTLNQTDQFPVEVYIAGLAPLYVGQTYLGGAYPITIQRTNRAALMTMPRSDTFRLEDFLSTAWAIIVALADDQDLLDTLTTQVQRSASRQTVPRASVFELKPNMSITRGLNIS